MEFTAFFKTQKFKTILSIGIIVVSVIAIVLTLSSGYNNAEGFSPVFNSAEATLKIDYEYEASAFLGCAVKLGFNNSYKKASANTSKIEYDIVTEDNFLNAKLVLSITEGEITSYTVSCNFRKIDTDVTSNDGLDYDIRLLQESNNKKALLTMKQWNKAFISSLDKAGELNDAQISYLCEFADIAYTEMKVQTATVDNYSVYVAYEEGKTADSILFSIGK